MHHRLKESMVFLEVWSLTLIALTERNSAAFLACDQPALHHLYVGGDEGCLLSKFLSWVGMDKESS